MTVNPKLCVLFDYGDDFKLLPYINICVLSIR